MILSYILPSAMSHGSVVQACGTEFPVSSSGSKLTVKSVLLITHQLPGGVEARKARDRKNFPPISLPMLETHHKMC